MRFATTASFAFLLLALCATWAHSAELHLTHMRLKYAYTDRCWAEGVRVNRNMDGKPVSVAGRGYKTAVCAGNESVIPFLLDGKAERFTALCGVGRPPIRTAPPG